jgi:WD40 repeat protein
VNIFSTESERKVRSLELPEDAVTSLAWSRDDSRLAVAYYGDKSEIGVYDLGDLEAGATKTSKESSAPMRRLSVDGRQVTATSFNSTGEQIAASTALGLHIWDLQSDEATSSVLKPSHTHEQPEFASFLDWSEKDLLAVSYKEANLVRVFERSGSQLKYEVPTPRYPTCVRFAPGGDRLAIAGRDAVVHFCEAQNGHRLLTLKDSSNHSGTIALTVRVVFSRDGRRIAVNDWLGRITIWECRPK